MIDDDDDPLAAIGRTVLRTMDEIVRGERDSRRPKIEDVARVLDQTFEQMTANGEIEVVPVLRGPEFWSWTNMRMQRAGFEHVYHLGPSTMPGAEGYPLLTIRKSVAPIFDAQLTFSGLIFGPDDDQIAHAVAMLITNHNAAFLGLKDSVVMQSRRGTDAAIDAVREKVREGDTPVDRKRDPGDLN